MFKGIHKGEMCVAQVIDRFCQNGTIHETIVRFEARFIKFLIEQNLFFQLYIMISFKNELSLKKKR